MRELVSDLGVGVNSNCLGGLVVGQRYKEESEWERK